MTSPVVCPKQPLSRDLDVQISISRPITEIATDMTLLAFLTPSADFPPNNGRVRYYSSMKAVESDFAVNSEGWWAASAFFERSKHPLTMAIAAVFNTAQTAGLLSTSIDLARLKLTTNGSFSISVNETFYEADSINFTTATNLTSVVTILNASFAANNVPIAASERFGGLFIATNAIGEGATTTYFEPSGTGVDISTMLGLTQAAGAQVWDGYTPGNLAEEAKLVDIASRCNGKPIYGWTLDRTYRKGEEQKTFADWIEAKTPAYFSACTNSVTAYNMADTTNIGYYVYDKGYKRTSTIYHDNPQVYPDVSYIALALATNYANTDSAITMKFKQLEGIETTPMTETILAALDSRRINCYVAIGNTSKTTREGVQAADTWFTDTLVNLDNYREELQVEVYNVFLRNKKVPYTTAGQDKLVSAAAKICNRYVRNGVFADRDVEDDTLETGFSTMPAYSIEPVNIAMATTSERAARIAPPISITAYEAGAFHKVSIEVDVYN